MSLQTPLTKPKSRLKRRKISLYGNFGAGNLGNECSLQTIIEQILRRWPDAQLQCFCTGPQDVRARHNIAAFPAEAVGTTEGFMKGGPQSGLARALRLALRRIPLELVHWTKSLRAVWRSDMLIVAGTGIVSDHLCGPLGWSYDIFKLSTLAALCRAKLVFLSVGVGPLGHPLSRWFIKRSFALADHRSYRDQASKQYLETIGFNTDRDFVYPDVAFALAPGSLASAVPAGERRVVGLGLKDYGLFDRLKPIEPKAFEDYLGTMAAFISSLHARGYGVRLLAGDFQYDTPVVRQLVALLKRKNISTDAPLLRSEPALTVNELLSQICETEVVISPRYHNLLLALIQNKPVIALSDHPKLDSLVTDIGLGNYLLPLVSLSSDVLIDKFKQLEENKDSLKLHIAAEVKTYRQELDSLYAGLFVADQAANVGAKLTLTFKRALDRPISTDRLG